MNERPSSDIPKTTTNRLRLRIFDRDLDAAVASLTEPMARSILPDQQYVFSQQALTVDQSDLYDGVSQNKRRYDQYAKKIGEMNHVHYKYNAMAGINVLPSKSDKLIVGFRIRLGQMALQNIVAPLYEHSMQPQPDYLPVILPIRNPAQNIKYRFDHLRDVLQSEPKLDELTIVRQGIGQNRPIFFDRLVRDTKEIARLDRSLLRDPVALPERVIVSDNVSDQTAS